MRVSVACIALAAGLPVPVFAAEIEAPSRIVAVTVFPDGAAVTRSMDVTLPPGASTVVLRGLAAAADPASIRVQGEGTGRLLLGAVETRAVPADPRAGLDPVLDGRIEAVKAEREEVAGRLEAAEAKKAAILRFSQVGPEKLSPDAKPLDVDRWPAVWDALGDGLAKANESLRELRNRARRLDADLVALERTRQRPASQGPRRDLVIAVETDGAAASTVPVTGRLTVTYRVSGAGWQPLYDARLDTGARDRKPALAFERRAQITQRTGEDWGDVALTVSTVRAARGTAAPEVLPMLVTFFEPVVAMNDQRRDEMVRGRVAESMARVAPASAPPAPAKVVATEQEAVLESGAFQAAFRVAGTATVPGDGTPKALLLGSRAADPSLSVRVAPTLDETAYLDAAFVNEEDAPVLPGTVTLHRDGTYVGRGRLGLIAPGDKVELGFGADDKVKVVRVPVRRRENEPSWIGSTKSELREYKTTVKNLHDAALRITVTDQIPVSENTAITIEPTGITPPTEKVVADKRGVMAWGWDYQPGEQKEIRLGWRMKWPADREVVIQGQGPGFLRR